MPPFGGAAALADNDTGFPTATSTGSASFAPAVTVTTGCTPLRAAAVPVTCTWLSSSTVYAVLSGGASAVLHPPVEVEDGLLELALVAHDVGLGRGVCRAAVIGVVHEPEAVVGLDLLRAERAVGLLPIPVRRPRNACTSTTDANMIILP